MNKAEFLIPAIDADTPDMAVALRKVGAKADVDVVNWDEFPLRPKVRAFLGHDGCRLWCLFDVCEQHVRVRSLDADGPVWEDSCVELFIADPDGEHYYNFETNAGGTNLAARRSSRTDFHLLPEVIRRGMVVKSSLPHEVFDLRDPAGVEWNLLIGIPFSAIGYAPGEVPSNLKMNMYKCGDLTDAPHFLSWRPIDTPTPDFHRPEFFGNVILQKNND